MIKTSYVIDNQSKYSNIEKCEAKKKKNNNYNK